jgi:type VI secretion system protein ImpM
VSDDRVAGWYGKLASLGDFASRRLPSTFITRWDEWLQQVITDSRGALGDAWLDAYLSCPVWRFVLFPGVCGETTWMGVLMPSVDKVGRYFPLTIACEIPGFVTSEREFDALADWLDRLETLALSTLDTTRDARDFDDDLLALHAPAAAAAASRLTLARQVVATLRDDGATLFTLPSDDELAQTLMGAGAALLQESVRGGSLWWTPGKPGAGAPLLACRGLPDGFHFAAMLQAISTRTA